MNLTRTLFDRAATEPDQAALVDAVRASTWQEVAKETARTANALLQTDLAANRGRLAVLGENSSETVIIYAAAVLAGVSTILLNYHQSVEELVYVLEDNGATALWSTAGYSEAARQASAGFGQVPDLSRPGDKRMDTAGQECRIEPTDHQSSVGIRPPLHVAPRGDPRV